MVIWVYCLCHCAKYMTFLLNENYNNGWRESYFTIRNMGKGHEHSAFAWDERGIAVKALMDEDYA